MTDFLRKGFSLLFPFFTLGATGADLLVEAESFANPGGWKVDAQFIDEMGSPYLARPWSR